MFVGFVVEILGSKKVDATDQAQSDLVLYAFRMQGQAFRKVRCTMNGYCKSLFILTVSAPCVKPMRKTTLTVIHSYTVRFLSRHHLSTLLCSHPR